MQAAIVDRDPRSDPHAASDTRADPQIPQSLIAPGYRRAVHFPEHRRQTGALLPPYRAPSPGGGLRGLLAGDRRAGRPARARRRPQGPPEAGAAAGSSQPATTSTSRAAALRRAAGRLDARPGRARRARERAGRRPRAARRRRGCATEAMQARARRPPIERLAGAQADLAAGQAGRRRPAARRSPTPITSIYEEGDPQLLAFASLLDAQTPRRPHPAGARRATSSSAARPGRTTTCTPPRCCSRSARTRSRRPGTTSRCSAGPRPRTSTTMRDARPPQTLAAKRHGRRSCVAARRPPSPRPAGPRSATSAVLARLHAAGEPDPATGSSPQARAAARPPRPRGGYRGRTGGLPDCPVAGPVTSPFGYRVHPIYHY